VGGLLQLVVVFASALPHRTAAVVSSLTSTDDRRRGGGAGRGRFGADSLLTLWPRPLRPGGRCGHSLVVDARVLGQVVGPRKPFFAHVATVRLDAGVRPTVSGQFVGPGEPPRAARPHAPVRLLARVPPHVHLWTKNEFVVTRGYDCNNIIGYYRHGSFDLILHVGGKRQAYH